MFHNDSLFVMIEEDFELVYTHNYRYSELNGMLHWEREILLTLVKQKIDEVE